MNWNKIFIYNDGTLEKIHSKRKVGSINSDSYIQVEYNNTTYMMHRIIYEMHYGEIPIGLQIDHFDRNPLNNKIENLRLATQSQNRTNSGAPSNSSTGIKGVHKTPSGKYQARLGIDGIKLYIGLFDNKEEADEAVTFVRRKLHGEFAT